MNKIDRRINLVKLEAEIVKYAFLSTYDRDVKLYNKRLRQLEFIKKFKNHKIKINL